MAHLALQAADGWCIVLACFMTLVKWARHATSVWSTVVVFPMTSGARLLWRKWQASDDWSTVVVCRPSHRVRRRVVCLIISSRVCASRQTFESASLLHLGGTAARQHRAPCFVSSVALRRWRTSLTASCECLVELRISSMLSGRVHGSRGRTLPLTLTRGYFGGR